MNDVKPFDLDEFVSNLARNYLLVDGEAETIARMKHSFELDQTWDDLLDEREDKEVSFARLYATEFAHGTAGHNQYMLIAKMGQLLDVYESSLHYLIEYVSKNKLP